jgi:release factor glutamine methyltransferase
MTIEELRKKFLLDAHPAEADSLLQLCCKKDKTYVLTHPDHRLNPLQMVRFYSYLKLFKKGYPLEYISEKKEFYKLDFTVTEDTLIPRPETELMVDEALRAIKNWKGEEGVMLLDVGTGTGCIPIAIAKNLDKKITIVATDISDKALKVAEKNMKKHSVEMTLVEGDLLTPIFEAGVLEHHRLFITANLPYGWSEWYGENPALKFEPETALLAGSDGLELYRKFIPQLGDITLPFTAFLEIDPRQSEKISKIITSAIPGCKFEIKKDLAGRDRLVVIERA